MKYLRSAEKLWDEKRSVEMAGACRKVSLRNGGAMGDYMVRATAANAQVRAFAATTKELVETARQAHNTSPVATAALGS